MVLIYTESTLILYLLSFLSQTLGSVVRKICSSVSVGVAKYLIPYYLWCLTIFCQGLFNRPDGVHDTFIVSLLSVHYVPIFKRHSWTQNSIWDVISFLNHYICLSPSVRLDSFVDLLFSTPSFNNVISPFVVTP